MRLISPSLFRVFLVYSIFINYLYSLPIEKLFLACIKTTYGVEWEFRPIELIDNPATAYIDGANYSRIVEESLYISELKKAYAYFGKDETGTYVKGLIPSRLYEELEFKLFLSKYSKYIVQKEGKYYFSSNMPGENSSEFTLIMRELFEVRGKYNTDLVLKKDPTFWSDKKTDLDELIPDIIAEEFSGTRFANIEFPTSKPLSKVGEWKEYISNLWKRLNFHNGDDELVQQKLEKAHGHIHMVPNLSKYTPEQKQVYYSNMKKYWGDLNDEYELTVFTPYFKEKTNLEGTVTLDKLDIQRIYKFYSEEFLQYSRRPLTKEKYDAISVQDGRIKAKEGYGTMEENVDPELPSELKRLPVGLRSIYGDGVYGIEQRSTPFNTFTEKEKIANRNDLNNLGSQEVLEGPRGLENTVPGLEKSASEIGINPKIISHTSELIESEEGWMRNWAKKVGKGFYETDEKLAQYFKPLNDWISHPIVIKKLNGLSKVEQESFLVKYNLALQKYAENINNLYKARTDGHYVYKPDIVGNWPEYSNGYNRVFYHEGFDRNVGELGTDQLASDPNIWFRAILTTESARFFHDSGLLSLFE